MSFPALFSACNSFNLVQISYHHRQISHGGAAQKSMQGFLNKSLEHVKGWGEEVGGSLLTALDVHCIYMSSLHIYHERVNERDSKIPFLLFPFVVYRVFVWPSYGATIPFTVPHCQPAVHVCCSVNICHTCDCVWHGSNLISCAKKQRQEETKRVRSAFAARGAL